MLGCFVGWLHRFELGKWYRLLLQDASQSLDAQQRRNDHEPRKDQREGKATAVPS